MSGLFLDLVLFIFGFCWVFVGCSFGVWPAFVRFSFFFAFGFRLDVCLLLVWVSSVLVRFLFSVFDLFCLVCVCLLLRFLFVSFSFFSDFG